MEGIQPTRFLVILAANDSDQAANSKITLSDFAPVYYLFKDFGADIVLTTLTGEYPELSDVREKALQHQAVRRFMDDRVAREELADTLSLEQIDLEDFDAIFCLGMSRHLWDFENSKPRSFLASFLDSGKPVAIFPAHLVTLRLQDDRHNRLITEGSDGSPLTTALALLEAAGRRSLDINTDRTTT
jgi:hypothetical protein